MKLEQLIQKYRFITGQATNNNPMCPFKSVTLTLSMPKIIMLEKENPKLHENFVDDLEKIKGINIILKYITEKQK